MDKQIKIESNAPTIHPVEYAGWHQCTDGTWVELPEVLTRAFARPHDHFSRRTTEAEERAHAEKRPCGTCAYCTR